MTAFLATVLVGLVLPLIGPGLLKLLWLVWTISANSGSLFGSSAQAGLLQFTIAIFCWKRLYERLVKRAFPLERGEAQ